MAKDNFSLQSKAYAAFRPKFPDELYRFIVQQAAGHDLAWDVATGNGQSAVKLAPYFKQVVATDISDNQLSHAPRLPNIAYRAETAEHSSLEDHSADLVTISQALHWFDFDRFFAEVKRVAKPGAIVAAFSYSMFRVADEQIDPVIQAFYKNSFPFWDTERKFIDEEYKTIPFPFTKIETPSFTIAYEWTLDQVLGYIATWSANQHHIKQFGHGLITASFREKLQRCLPPGGKLSLQFPVHTRIGKVLHE